MDDRCLALMRELLVLADSLRPDSGIIDVLDRLVEVTTAFTPAVEAGVVLADAAGNLHVVASTSERTTDVEEEQLGAKSGPCLDCFRSGEPVNVPVVAAERGRWPEFVDLALERGFVSAHAVPLAAGGRVLGSMNFFADDAGELSDDDLELVSGLAAIAAVNVAQREATIQHLGTNAQLQHALTSRILIEQAKGVIAYRDNIGVDAAFQKLRRYARNNGFRLIDVASDVVERQKVL